MKYAEKLSAAQKRQTGPIYIEYDDEKHIEDMLSEFDRGKDLESRNPLGQTALILAVADGSTTLVRKLLDRGANVNALTTSGESVLHYAASNEATAEIILKAGANVMASDAEGETPLHCAVFWGSKALTQKLIDAGADVSALSTTLGTPLHAALLNGHDECARLLMLAGARNDIKHKGVTPAGLAGRLKNRGLADEIRAYTASAKATQAVEIMMRAHGLMNGSSPRF